MKDVDKLSMLKTMLAIDDNNSDDLLSTYLTFAKNEILSWRYSYAEDMPVQVPREYEMTQIQAVVNGFTQRGAEGQIFSIENGIHRHFVYADMVRYIRANVIPMARLAAVSTT